MADPSPVSPEVKARLAELNRAIFSRESKGAARLYREILAVDPEFLLKPPVQFDLARLLELGGEPELALKAFTSIVERQPDAPARTQALRQCGNLSFRLKRFEAAFEFLTLFLQTDPPKKDRLEAEDLISRIPEHARKPAARVASGRASAQGRIGNDPPPAPPRPVQPPPAPPSRPMAAPPPDPPSGPKAGAIHAPAPARPSGMVPRPTSPPPPQYGSGPSDFVGGVVPPRPLTPAPSDSGDPTRAPGSGRYMLPQRPPAMVPPPPPPSSQNFDDELPPEAVNLRIQTPVTIRSAGESSSGVRKQEETAEIRNQRRRGSQFALILPLNKRIHLEAVAELVARWEEVDEPTAKKRVIARKGMVLENLSLQQALDVRKLVAESRQQMVFVIHDHAVRPYERVDILGAEVLPPGLKLTSDKGLKKARWEDLRLLSCGILNGHAQLDLFSGLPLKHFRFSEGSFNFRTVVDSAKRDSKRALIDFVDLLTGKAPTMELSHTVQNIRNGRASEPQTFPDESEYEHYNRWLLFSHFGEVISDRELDELDRLFGGM